MTIAPPESLLRPEDVEFFERELASFVPDSLFDSHIHLGLRSDCAESHQTLMANTPEVADMPTYRTQMDWIARGREVVGALVLPTTLEGKRMAEGNACAAREARTDHASKTACAELQVAIKPIFELSSTPVLENGFHFRQEFRMLLELQISLPERNIFRSLSHDRLLFHHTRRCCNTKQFLIRVHPEWQQQDAKIGSTYSYSNRFTEAHTNRSPTDL